MYDAIVVGARCAGSPTAMLLARKGYRVLLLDRAALPSEFAHSTHFIHARGLAKLREWGLLETLPVGDCAPIRSMTVRAGDLEISAPPAAFEGMRDGFAPRRLVLDAFLLKAAVAAGAELRDRCEVRHLLRDGDRVCGVRGVMESGAAFEERARIVIGADGPGSRVAHEAGAREYHQRQALQGTIWGYYSGIPLDRFEIDQGVGEAVYRFPTAGATLVGVNLAEPGFKAAFRDPEPHFADLLGRLTPAFNERVRAGRREEPLRRGSTRNFFRDAAGPGWALVGDAGYKKDPATAQGITDAFVDAADLTSAVDEGLDGRRSLDDALGDWHRTRDAWALPFYEFTCEMARFAAPDPAQQALFRALSEQPAEAEAFFGLISEATEPAEFFAPENLGRIVGPGS